MQTKAEGRWLACMFQVQRLMGENQEGLASLPTHNAIRAFESRMERLAARDDFHYENVALLRTNDQSQGWPFMGAMHALYQGTFLTGGMTIKAFKEAACEIAPAHMSEDAALGVAAFYNEQRKADWKALRDTNRELYQEYVSNFETTKAQARAKRG